MKSEEKKTIPKPKQEPEEVDFSEGFGGIPSDTSLTGNLSCVPERKKPKDKPKWKEA
jgi:hypothetical protein